MFTGKNMIICSRRFFLFLFFIFLFINKIRVCFPVSVCHPARQAQAEAQSAVNGSGTRLRL